jgi:hypothetical protein
MKKEFVILMRKMQIHLGILAKKWLIWFDIDKRDLQAHQKRLKT